MAPAGQILHKTPRPPSQPRSVAFGSSGDRRQDPPSEAGDGAGVTPRLSGARRAGQARIRAGQEARPGGGAGGRSPRGSPWPRRRSGRPGSGPRGPLPQSSSSSSSRNCGRRRSRVSMAGWLWRAVGSVPAGCAGGAGGRGRGWGRGEPAPRLRPPPRGRAHPPGTLLLPERALVRDAPSRDAPTRDAPHLPQNSPPSRSAHPQDTPPTPGASPGPPVSGCCRRRARGWQDGGGWGGGAA